MLNRIFGYKALEARLEDKDKEILRLIEENRDLRDRLFLKYSLPVSGINLQASNTGNSVQGWRTPKQRLKDYLNEQDPPLVTTLTDAELRHLESSIQ